MRLTHVSILVVAAVLGSACSNTIAVGRLDGLPSDQAFVRAKKITTEFGDTPAWVTIGEPTTPDEYVHTSYGTLSIADGQTFLLRVPPQEDVRVSFERTRQVTYRNRVWGGLGGAGIGLGGGAAAGLAASLLYNAWNSVDCFWNSHGSEYDKPSSCDARMGRATGLKYGAVLGTAIGAVVGAIIGHKTYVTF